MRRLLAALLAALAAGPAAAQLRGRVVDASGGPVPDALVEAWVDARPAAEAQTDARGGFRLAGVRPEAGTMLTVRRVGLQTRTVRLTRADTVVLVRMEVPPVVLPPLSATAVRHPPCPRPEDPQAHRLWERMRARYRQPAADSVFVAGFVESRTGVGENADDGGPRAEGASAGWTTGALIVADPELMRLSEYATPASGGAGERTRYWAYRPLDGGTAQDFTSDYFGAAHTFSIVYTAPDGLTRMIGFCPREELGRRGQVQGTLTLAFDTTLQMAEWRFRTPFPNESAGGQASYYRPDPALDNALLARESMYWRRTDQRLYWFQAQKFSGWTRGRPVTHPGGARPAPPRPPGARP